MADANTSESGNSNPDQGVDFVNQPQLDYTGSNRYLWPHIFPANKGAWSRFTGPRPQLGSVLEITMSPKNPPDQSGKS